MPYAADTSTPVEKTRAELETTLQRFGAQAFGYMTDDKSAVIQFRASERFVRFILPLPSPSDERFTHYTSRGSRYKRAAEPARKEWEQECRSAWRALFLAVKAKLVAVEAKISTFDQEFLAHVVLPNGQTAGETIIPKIEQSYKTGQMPEFILALPAPKSR